MVFDSGTNKCIMTFDRTLDDYLGDDLSAWTIATDLGDENPTGVVALGDATLRFQVGGSVINPGPWSFTGYPQALVFTDRSIWQGPFAGTVVP
jgi:hypothetical protein